MCGSGSIRLWPLCNRAACCGRTKGHPQERLQRKSACSAVFFFWLVFFLFWFNLAAVCFVLSLFFRIAFSCFLLLLSLFCDVCSFYHACVFISFVTLHNMMYLIKCLLFKYLHQISKYSGLNFFVCDQALVRGFVKFCVMSIQ